MVKTYDVAAEVALIGAVREILATTPKKEVERMIADLVSMAVDQKLIDGKPGTINRIMATALGFADGSSIFTEALVVKAGVVVCPEHGVDDCGCP